MRIMQASGTWSFMGGSENCLSVGRSLGAVLRGQNAAAATAVLLNKTSRAGPPMNFNSPPPTRRKGRLEIPGEGEVVLPSKFQLGGTLRVEVDTPCE